MPEPTDRQTRIFRVGTFYRRPRSDRPVKTAIAAYTRWYNKSWSGCIEYEVAATSGTKARNAAIELRLAHERRRRGDA